MKGKQKAKATKIPTSYDELFPGRFLRGTQFKGQAGMLTMKEVWRERMEDEEWAVIISFEGIEQQLVLNKTNGECLAGMFGKKISDWLGKRVTFCPRKVKAFGQVHEAIRVYGSPDIERDIRVNVNAGMASATVTMKKTEPKRWTAVAESAPVEEYEDFDPETGEIGPEEQAEIHAQEMAQAGAT